MAGTPQQTINGVSAGHKLLISAQKKECNGEYYDLFLSRKGARSWMWIAGIGIAIIIALLSFNIGESRVVADKQIRQEGQITRLEEKHQEVMGKLSDIQETLKNLNDKIFQMAE